ncbi:MAG TPA: thiamine-phosphate pyrophosphorylase [Candidatus Bathyarchaeia archaeon]|nr:thiamine-phosphate pyrophosphorylase [Candidatus Bathyarchaeia archaeon]
MNKAAQGINRILDANLNRTKEGLRVCEDICRFIYDDGQGALVFKKMRHELAQIFSSSLWRKMVAARDVAQDVGKGSVPTEMRRRDAGDLLFANLQRVKESSRVLEELMKLRSGEAAQRLKVMRYRVYRIEQRMSEKISFK